MEVPGDSEHASDTEELPPLFWELVSQRKQLPESLQLRIGLAATTLRVSRQVDLKIRTAHPEDIACYEQLDALFPEWKHVVPDPKSASTWQIYVPLTDAHWLAVVIGKDRNDSVNLISVFQIRSRNVRARVRRQET